MQAVNGPITLAVVDADQDFRDYLSARLSGEEDVEAAFAESGDALIDLLRDQAVDCVALGQNLGDDAGVALAARIRRLIDTPPPIVTTAAVAPERSVSNEAGDADQTGTLACYAEAATRMLAKVRDTVSADRYARMARSDPDAVKKYLTFDPATGLYGQHSIEAYLKERTSGTSDEPLAVIALRPKGFSRIETQLSLPVGEAILFELGLKLRTDTRGSDRRGRWDRTTFVYVVEHFSHPADVLHFCATLAERLTFEFSTPEATVPVACDIGVALHPENGDDHLTLLESAFSAMHRCGQHDGAFEAAFSVDELGATAKPEPVDPADASGFPAGGRRTADRRSKA